MEAKTGEITPDTFVETEKTTPFMTHLEEFRLRILISLGYIVAGAVAGFFLTEKYIFNWLLLPVTNVPGINLQVIGPVEKLAWLFKSSFIVGIILATPFILHQLWLFLRPGLRPLERKYFLGLIPSAAILFAAGAAFVFFVMVPAVLQINNRLDFGVEIQSGISLENYFSFMFGMILAGGLLFQIPLVTFFLAKTGIINAKFMADNRKYALFFVVLLAAIVTPTGDALNLMLLSVPIYLLYEISILIAMRVGQRQQPSS